MRFFGIDVASGVSSGASKTAVVCLSETIDTPYGYATLKAETQDFDERLAEIGGFCRSELIMMKARNRNESVTMISKPRMSLMRYMGKNKRTGAPEKKVAMSRSAIDLAQVRGAVIYAIHNITTHEALVENVAKFKFTGKGDAKKDKIALFVKSKWPNVPDDADVVDAYMMAYIAREQYTERKKW